MPLTPEQQALREVNAMMRSRYYQLLHRYFVQRREELFTEEPGDSLALAMNRGAIRELTRLLKHPELVVHALKMVRESVNEPEITPHVPETAEDNVWLRGILGGGSATGDDLA